jgi:hypothetical protein
MSYIDNAVTSTDGFWTLRNMRLFMENFARLKNMDPLLSETWSLISEKEMRQSKVHNSNISHCYIAFYE